MLAKDASNSSSMMKLDCAIGLGNGGIAQMSSSWLDVTEIGGWASWIGAFSVGMFDCWLQGIQPCKWKGKENGHQ
jgi:hypothetical protein